MKSLTQCEEFTMNTCAHTTLQQSVGWDSMRYWTVL